MKGLLLIVVFAGSIACGQGRPPESATREPAMNDPGPIGTLAGIQSVDRTLYLKISEPAGRYLEHRQPG